MRIILILILFIPTLGIAQSTLNSIKSKVLATTSNASVLKPVEEKKLDSLLSLTKLDKEATSQLKEILDNKAFTTMVLTKEKDSLKLAINFYQEMKDEESTFNGNVNFSLLGNDAAFHENFTVAGGLSMDQGIYPYELDANVNFQSNFDKGKLAETVSNIDLSFDFHPAVGNGLFLENFVFLSRFSNTYVGIEQRYEAGGGIILNSYSSTLTESGDIKVKKLEELLTYGNNEKIKRCNDKMCAILNRDTLAQKKLKLNNADFKHLDKIRRDYLRRNRKLFAKVRIALLIGLYYEIEKAKVEVKRNFNSVKDSLFTRQFDATNKLRFELRPTLVYKPSDRFTVFLYPYFKLPVEQLYDKVVHDSQTSDSRIDAVFELKSGITANVTKNITIGLVYNRFFDYAPKRYYEMNNKDEAVLIEGQQFHNYYEMKVGFKF